MLQPEHLVYVGERLSVLLLSKIVAKQRLDYSIAKSFIESGHPSIVDALNELDLLAGIPSIPQTACRPLK